MKSGTPASRVSIIIVSKAAVRSGRPPFFGSSSRSTAPVRPFPSARQSVCASASIPTQVVRAPISVIITFIDRGVPYDPLKKDDPDVTLSAEERAIGGLGIFMVKKTMDEITYEYRDGQNILRIRKDI